MYEREENAQFSLISYSKERRFRVFQTLPDSWKNKKLLQVLTWFLKLGYYRDYLGNIWRNSKIHDCQPILENYRHWLLNLITLPFTFTWCSKSQRLTRSSLPSESFVLLTLIALVLMSRILVFRVFLLCSFRAFMI